MSAAGEGLTEPHPYLCIAQMQTRLAGGAKHRDFTVNHGVFITICPIIKLSECFHLAAAALMGCQMDSNTF